MGHPEYEFVNISLGPRMPVDDDDVHVWTAELDALLSNGKILATIAVGNDGEADAQADLDRIQVPADCVNGMSVGAADSLGPDWARAPYSSVGPGRRPGFVKPDCIAFGGSDAEPFQVIDPPSGTLLEAAGTSFAAPSVLRLAMGIRAHFGRELSPMALKSLIIHCADEHSAQGSQHVGWGRAPDSIWPIVTCSDHTARIVYQGTLQQGHTARMPIPLPPAGLRGNVKIHATFCYATEVDPQDPPNYTRAGLDVTFRPRPGTTDSFFRSNDYQEERGLRTKAHKWETTLDAGKTKRATSLDTPVFDVHYIAREAGMRARSRGMTIPYALVVTIDAPNTPDLYNRTLLAYPGLLQMLTPVIEIPIPVGI